jgi:hypothetical protein
MSLPYFGQLAARPDPRIPELQMFLDVVERFLDDLLHGHVRHDGDPPLSITFDEMREAALLTFDQDVIPSLSALRAAIPYIAPERLDVHGLTGTPQRFKLQALEALEQAQAGTDNFTAWVRSMLNGIDAILNSLVNAAGAVSGLPLGSLAQEFKDMLAAIL